MYNIFIVEVKNDVVIYSCYNTTARGPLYTTGKNATIAWCISHNKLCMLSFVQVRVSSLRGMHTLYMYVDCMYLEVLHLGLNSFTSAFQSTLFFRQLTQLSLQ